MTMATTTVGRTATARPRVKPRSTRFTPEAKTAALFLLPSFIGFVVFYAYPALRGFYLSFTDFNLLSQEGHWIGLQNYKGMFQDCLLYTSDAADEL